METERTKVEETEIWSALAFYRQAVFIERLLRENEMLKSALREEAQPKEHKKLARDGNGKDGPSIPAEEGLNDG